MIINSYAGAIKFIILSCLLCPLGCISLWRRCTYLSDGLSHAAVLANAVAGICLYDAFPISTIIALLLVLLIYWLEDSSDIYVATNIVATVAIALSIIIGQLYSDSVNIGNIVFGDSQCCAQVVVEDLFILLPLVFVCTIFISLYFNQLVLIALE